MKSQRLNISWNSSWLIDQRIFFIYHFTQIHFLKLNMWFLKSNICKGNWTDPNLPSMFNGKDVVKFEAILFSMHIFFFRKKNLPLLHIPLCAHRNAWFGLVWVKQTVLITVEQRKKKELFIQVMGSGKICVKAFYVAVVFGHSIVSCLSNSYFLLHPTGK